MVDNLSQISGEVKNLGQQTRMLGENLEQVKASNFSLGTATLEARTEDRQKVQILEGEIHKLWEAQKNADGVNLMVQKLEKAWAARYEAQNQKYQADLLEMAQSTARWHEFFTKKIAGLSSVQKNTQEQIRGICTEFQAVQHGIQVGVGMDCEASLNPPSQAASSSHCELCPSWREKFQEASSLKVEHPPLPVQSPAEWSRRADSPRQSPAAAVRAPAPACPTGGPSVSRCAPRGPSESPNQSRRDLPPAHIPRKYLFDDEMEAIGEPRFPNTDNQVRVTDEGVAKVQQRGYYGGQVGTEKVLWTPPTRPETRKPHLKRPKRVCEPFCSMTNLSKMCL